MSARCVECGTVPSLGARYCPGCGSALQDLAARATDDEKGSAVAQALGAGYDIVRLLGRGGMGAVYLARETALDRLVAVKVLASGVAENTAMRDRFRREARIAARLTHPHIVPLHSFGEAPSLVYFVMGYVRGESLAARLRRESTMAPEDARRILAEIADALDYAHRQGIVHRDVKPDNILIDDETGRAVLADFGVARGIGVGGTVTATGMLIGTPAYMSPEQASGRSDLDGRSDLYSLGLVGYAMLAGRPPFDGRDAADLVLQRLSATVPPLQSVAADVPPDLAEAIDRCLKKDPAERWPDARSLRGALQAEGATPGMEAVSEVQGHAAVWLMTLMAAMNATVYRWGMGFGTAEIKWASPLADLISRLFQVAPLIVAFIVSGGMIRARRAGASWTTIWSAALRTSAVSLPPLRVLPGDVWPRLPASLRRARVAFAVGRILFFGLAVPGVLLIFTPAMWRDWGALLHTPLPKVFVFASGLIVLVAGAVFAVLWTPQVISLRRRGFSAHDVSRLLFEPTWRPAFWRHPKIAALLVAPAAAVPQRPADYLRVISGLVQQSGGVASSIGAAAVAVARDVLVGIERLDAEVAELQPQADPSDRARLEQRLAAMGERRAGEADEKRQLREVLERQRELSVRLSTLLEERAAARRRLADLLDRVWRDVQRLGAMPAAEAKALVASWRSSADALERSLGGPSASPPTEELPTLKSR